MELRTRETEMGWLVEYKKKNCLMKDKWLPFITYSGMKEPFYFSEKSRAIDAALTELKNHMIDG